VAKPITPQEMTAYVEATWNKCQEEAWQEQEPVAWMHEKAGGYRYYSWQQQYPDDTPLYTAPPKREWVGLPDEKEILEMSKDAWGRALLNYGRDDHCSFYVAFARAIETYLKEKNGG
jgi:hypothetical protein